MSKRKRLGTVTGLMLMAAVAAGCASGTGDLVEPSPTPEPGAAQEPEPRAVVDISESIESIVLDNNLPAMGAAIVDAAGVRDLGVSGFRSKVAGASRAEEGDAWHLGSNTKAMTAVLAARLVEQEVIDWTTTVADVWPAADQAWSQVTLESLFQHRGGVTGSIPADYPSAWTAMASQEGYEGRTAFVETLVTTPPDAPVGTFLYSNAGYMMAGAMLEVRGGQPWQQLMEAEIFAPLQMPSCGFGAPLGDSLWGHAGATGTPVEPGLAADNPRPLGPAGTVHCSLEDYGRFLAIFLEDSEQYLSAVSRDRLTTPEGDYALGWGVTTQPWSPGPVVTHVGSNTLWYANAWVSPSLGRAFVAVTNSGQTGAFEATNAVIVDLITRETSTD